jgi:hypothetical protein
MQPALNPGQEECRGRLIGIQKLDRGKIAPGIGEGIVLESSHVQLAPQSAVFAGPAVENRERKGVVARDNEKRLKKRLPDRRARDGSSFNRGVMLPYTALAVGDLRHQKKPAMGAPPGKLCLVDLEFNPGEQPLVGGKARFRDGGGPVDRGRRFLLKPLVEMDAGKSGIRQVGLNGCLPSICQDQARREYQAKSGRHHTVVPQFCCACSSPFQEIFRLNI